MPSLNGHLREHVVREMRRDIRRMAAEGMSAKEIEQRVNGHHALTDAEQGLIELLTHHAVAEARGHF